MSVNVAAIIPTLGRPDKIRPLVKNILQTGATPILVMESHDTESQREAKEAGAYCIVGEFGSAAAGFNAGYSVAERSGTYEWIHTGNDDVVYDEFWVPEALKVAEKTGAKIIGTNDGHGKYSAFSFVNVDYIRQHSGVHYAPNQLMHEFKSQYCDTLLTDYAIWRGVYAEAPKSITHHHHWVYGEADRNHPNYIKAQTHWAEDQATYNRLTAEYQAQVPKVEAA